MVYSWAFLRHLARKISKVDQIYFPDWDDHISGIQFSPKQKMNNVHSKMIEPGAEQKLNVDILIWCQFLPISI